jgi:hypothetical protein
MRVLVLYHCRSLTPDEEWDRLGHYETLEAAQEAAGEHGIRPGAELQAWIIERSGADEWRVVAGGEAYKVVRVRLPE